MRKYVYVLHYARTETPYESRFTETYDSAEALLSQLIYEAKIHNLRYPAKCLQSIADSVNFTGSLYKYVANFYADGRILFGENSTALYVPYLVAIVPLERGRVDSVPVNVNTIAEASA